MIADRGLRNVDWAIALLLCLLTAVAAGGETLESLDRQISSVDSQLARMEKEYQKLSRLNAEHLQRVEHARAKREDTVAERELQSAYGIVEQMNGLSASLNQLRSRKELLCGQWAVQYRGETDALLQAADRERDRRKRAEIGRKLQHLQRRNAELCPQERQSTVSFQWKSLRIEAYDGPREIGEKIQLLEDVSRELRLQVSNLDTRYQDAIRERKTRERAQEFIQEGTLFNDPSTLLTTSRAQVDTGSPVTNGGPGYETTKDVTGEVGTTVALPGQDWQQNENTALSEKNYRKNRADLLALQKELQQKIEEFKEKAGEFQIP